MMITSLQNLMSEVPASIDFPQKIKLKKTGQHISLFFKALFWPCGLSSVGS